MYTRFRRWSQQGVWEYIFEERIAQDIKERCAKEAAEAVLIQIDTMKKAILARAFRGKLGTSGPVEEWAGTLLNKSLCA